MNKSLHEKLTETKSLTEFKQNLWVFLRKYKRAPMTEEDYRIPQPLALLAYKDGQNRLVELLDPYLEEPDNG